MRDPKRVFDYEAAGIPPEAASLNEFYAERIRERLEALRSRQCELENELSECAFGSPEHKTLLEELEFCHSLLERGAIQ